MVSQFVLAVSQCAYYLCNNSDSLPNSCSNAPNALLIAGVVMICPVSQFLLRTNLCCAIIFSGPYLGQLIMLVWQRLHCGHGLNSHACVNQFKLFCGRTSNLVLQSKAHDILQLTLRMHISPCSTHGRSSHMCATSL